MKSFKTKNYSIGFHHVVNDKKGRLRNFEKLWKLLQKNPGRILSFKANPRLKESLNHPTLLCRKEVFSEIKNKIVFTWL